MRTGAAGAVAAKYLSARKEIVLGVIGTGRQAQAQVTAISRELKIRQTNIWSCNPDMSGNLLIGLRNFPVSLLRWKIPATVMNRLPPPPQEALLSEVNGFDKGTHINAIGADAPGKEELAPSLLRRAQVLWMILDRLSIPGRD